MVVTQLITLVTSKGNSYIDCWFSLWCICVVLEFFKIMNSYFFYNLENNRGLFLESVEMQRKELTLSVVWNALELKTFFPHLIHWTLLVILHQFCLALPVFFTSVAVLVKWTHLPNYVTARLHLAFKGYLEFSDDCLVCKISL